MKQISLSLLIMCCAFQVKAQIIINPKGTRITIDSSKWKINGNNIFYKNIGNVGIGTNNPTAQFHTTSTVRFQGLGSNIIDTRILTTDAAGNITTRLLSTLPTNIDSTTSNNGLTLTGKNIQLGGNLIVPTTISNNEKPLTFATGGADLNITGLTAGATTDSLLTVNTITGKINRINLSSLNKVDSTTSNNGLTLTGKNVQLGGNLTQATTITNNANPLTIATGGTALNITGLTAGAATDSILTINTTTGKVSRINLPTAINKVDSTTSNNGLTLTGKNVQLGGNLTQATTITNNANPLTIATGGTALNITGLTAGAATDSILTINTTTGKVSRINLPTAINKIDSTTADNGLTLIGKNIQFGGNLIQATSIVNNGFPLKISTGGADLNITGLTAGATTDSLLSINTITGKINRINLSSLNKVDSTTANNGLTLTGKNVQLGGNLTQPTTITNNANPLTIATGGAALNITGLTSGSAIDSILTVNTITGKISRVNLPTPINKNDSTTANNGLTLTGKNVQLGGNLTQATIITNNANPLTIATGGTALNITGLTAGAGTDSILTVNTTTGKISRISLPTSVASNKIDSTTANNGLTLTGKNVQLGGNLTQATTITNNANPLTIATGGAALNITGLTAGGANDDVVVLDAAGRMKLIPIPGNVVPVLLEIYDAAGTQALTNVFANLNLGTNTIVDPGYTVAGGVVTIAKASLYKITYRVTAKVTNNIASGGEFVLTNAGTAIPGTLSYIYLNNADVLNGTATVVTMVQLAAGSTIAIQGRRYSAAGNLTLTANGSSLLIEKVR